MNKNHLKLFTFLSLLVLLFTTMGTVLAVTDGELDGNGHPYVGLLIFDVNGRPAWRCSGTLLSPTVLLTAGHCTDGATSGRVWFESDLTNAAAVGYPFGGATSIEFVEIHTHPQFHEGSFVLHDVGVVVLASPAPVSGHGVLPTANQLDSLANRRGQQNVSFTAVGYGLQESFPDAASWQESALRIRMVAHPHLLQINVPGFTGSFSLLLSNNASTGGTCFGDSGGPNFIGNSNVIGGVTSFGINGNCAGTGGVFRMDRQNVLDFVNGILNEN
jgi:V8-like Glu-specific endopeptidase